MRLSKMIITIAGTRIKTMDMHETLRKVSSLRLDFPVKSGNSMYFEAAKKHIKAATIKADRANGKKELAWDANDCEGRCPVSGRKHMSWYL